MRKPILRHQESAKLAKRVQISVDPGAFFADMDVCGSPPRSPSVLRPQASQGGVTWQGEAAGDPAADGGSSSSSRKDSNLSSSSMAQCTWGDEADE
jgi:hypothetical protein